MKGKLTKKIIKNHKKIVRCCIYHDDEKIYIFILCVALQKKLPF